VASETVPTLKPARSKRDIIPSYCQEHNKVSEPQHGLIHVFL
jgi:hypothetical protein